jgi:hypothetical protein
MLTVKSTNALVPNRANVATGFALEEVHSWSSRDASWTAAQVHHCHARFRLGTPRVRLAGTVHIGGISTIITTVNGER